MYVEQFDIRWIHGGVHVTREQKHQRYELHFESLATAKCYEWQESLH